MNTERRKALRRKIIDGFAFYIQIPKFGMARHKLENVSESGLGFEVDSLGGSFTLKKDEQIDVHFHMNPSLYLKLRVQVARQEQKGEVQEIGASILDTQSKAYETYLSLVYFLDKVVDSGESNA